jgi:hypothetical protein
MLWSLGAHVGSCELPIITCWPPATPLLGASVADSREEVVVYEIDESEVPDGSVLASDDAEMVVHRACIAREEALGKPQQSL